MAHEIPYVATAIVSELRDLEAKVKRAYIPAEAFSGCYRPFRAVGFDIASLILKLGLDHKCATRSRVSNCSTGSLYMAT